jgi:hypothetical protein
MEAVIKIKRQTESSSGTGGRVRQRGREKVEDSWEGISIYRDETINMYNC